MFIVHVYPWIHGKSVSMSLVSRCFYFQPICLKQTVKTVLTDFLTMKQAESNRVLLPCKCIRIPSKELLYERRSEREREATRTRRFSLSLSGPAGSVAPAEFEGIVSLL